MTTLSSQDKYALTALIQDVKGKPGRFEAAAWVGCCPRGHIVLSAVAPYPARCTVIVDQPVEGEDVTRWTACGCHHFPLPNQAALLAAFRLGGWEAMAEAAQAMIASP